MATVITKTLRASGGDYTTIQAWIDDMAIQYQNLVSANVILRLDIYNDWPTGLEEPSMAFDQGFFSTDSQHYFLLYVVDSDRHDGTPDSGFKYTATSTGTAFNFNYDFVTLDGFEVSAPNSLFPTFHLSATAVLKNFILHDAVYEFCNTAGMLFENGIVYNFAKTGFAEEGLGFAYVTLKNVTMYLDTDEGGYGGDCAAIFCECEDVYVYSNHSYISYNVLYGSTGDYNAALAINGAITGLNSVTITDDSDMNNPVVNDYRIKSSSTLKTAGTSGGAIGSNYSPISLVILSARRPISITYS